MFKRRSVLLLREIACEKLMVAVSKVVESTFELESEDEQSRKVEEIKAYLNKVGATSDIFEALRIESREHSMEDILAFEILVNRTLKTFFSNEYCTFESCTERYLKALARSWAKLEKFNLSYVKMCSAYMEHILQILENSPNLKQIELPGNDISNEIWLQILSDHCPKLIYLSVDVSPTNMLANFLSNKSFTQTLTIMGFGFREIDGDELDLEIAKLLQICPNLMWFVNGPNIGPALRLCQKENKNFKCNICHLFECHPTRNMLQIIVSTCPKLKSFELVAPQINSLQVLAQTPLSNLDIRHFSYRDLLELTKKIGRNLQSLSLASHKGSLDVGELLEFCPSLRKLRLGNAVMGHYKWPFNVSKRGKIEKLHFVHNHMCTDIALNFATFFCCLTNLKFFYAEQIFFTDIDMQRIFGSGYFKQLETFFVKQARQLTIRSVYILLKCCPNLQFVGKLTGWSIRNSEIEAMPSLKFVDYSRIDMSEVSF